MFFMPYLHVLNVATNYLLFEYFSNKKLTKPNKMVDKKLVFKIWSLKKWR